MYLAREPAFFGVKFKCVKTSHVLLRVNDETGGVDGISFRFSHDRFACTHAALARGINVGAVSETRLGVYIAVRPSRRVRKAQE